MLNKLVWKQPTATRHQKDVNLYVKQQKAFKELVLEIFDAEKTITQVKICFCARFEGFFLGGRMGKAIFIS